MGWDKYLFANEEVRRIRERWATVSEQPIGANQRRSTAQARLAFAAKRARQRHNLVASGPPTPEAVSKGNAKKRYRRNSSNAPDSITDSDSEIEVLSTPSKRRFSSDHFPGLIEHRVNAILLLQDLIAETSNNVEAMRKGFNSLAARNFTTIPGISSLPIIGSTLNDVQFSKMVRSFQTSIREAVPYRDLVTLLSVEFGSNSILASPSSSNMDVSIPTVLHENEQAHTTEITVLEEEEMVIALVEPAKHHAESEKRKFGEIQLVMGLLKLQRCKLVNVLADGNCLYSSLVLSLRLLRVVDEDFDQKELMKNLLEFMRTKDTDWFKLPINQTKAQYLEHQAKDGVWSDENVVQAAAEYYQRTISVTSVYERTRTFVPPVRARGRPPTRVRLVLVNANHYMWACPSNGSP